MASALLFSAPPPLAMRTTRTRSPGTMETCRMAGVLSPVFRRAPAGSATQDLRRYPSRLPRRTPSSTAAVRSPPTRCTSCPRSRKTTASPVSWHSGMLSVRAISAFSSSCRKTSRPTSDSSRSRARSKKATTSSPKWQQASTLMEAKAADISCTCNSRMPLPYPSAAISASCRAAAAGSPRTPGEA